MTRKSAGRERSFRTGTSVKLETSQGCMPVQAWGAIQNKHKKRYNDNMKDVSA